MPSTQLIWSLQLPNQLLRQQTVTQKIPLIILVTNQLSHPQFVSPTGGQTNSCANKHPHRHSHLNTYKQISFYPSNSSTDKPMLHQQTVLRTIALSSLPSTTCTLRLRTAPMTNPLREAYSQTNPCACNSYTIHHNQQTSLRTLKPATVQCYSGWISRH